MACNATFQATPTRINAIRIIVRRTIELMLIRSKFRIETRSFQIINATIGPSRRRFTMTNTRFHRRLFTRTLMPLLTIANGLTFTFYLRIISARRKIPTSTSMSTQLRAMLTTKIRRITRSIALSITPFRNLRTMEVRITLPGSRANFVNNDRSNGLNSNDLNQLGPLINIRLIKVGGIVILGQISAIITLPMRRSIRCIRIMIRCRTRFNFIPFGLIEDQTKAFMINVANYNDNHTRNRRYR